MKRCDVCDRVKATQEQFKTIQAGEGEHLCWGEWSKRQCKAEALEIAELKQKVILQFIDGPLKEYLVDDTISFGKFKERINEVCGTDFCYSDLYPSYLFNAKIYYPESEQLLERIKQ